MGAAATTRRNASESPRLYGSGSCARRAQRSGSAPALSSRSGSKLLLEAMREAAHLLAIRLDDHVRDLAIQRIASRIELLHPCKRIRSLQQRPVLAVAGALPQRGGRCMEVEHRSTLLEPFAVRWTQHDPAAGGKHDIVLDDEVGEDGCFAVAKAWFALQLEDDRNRYAEPAFELDVGVEEWLVQAPGEQAAERRLAAARHAHQKKIAPMQMHRGIVHCSVTTIRARVAAGSRGYRTAVTDSLMIRGVRKIKSSVLSISLPVCLKT